MDENEVIGQQLKHLLPDNLLLFGRLDLGSNSTNNLLVSTIGLIKWNYDIESFLWKYLGKHAIIFMAIVII